MRRTYLPLVFVPAVFGLAVLYACSDDASSGTASTPDSGTTTPTSTSTSTATNNPPGDSSVPPADGGTDTTQPFTPASLGSKLVLWLDADRNFDLVDGGVVWKDQSPEGNNAIQNAAIRQPSRIDGGTLDAGTRGVIRFAGNNFLEIADDPSLQWGAGDYAIYVVMRHTQGDLAIVYAKWIDTSPFTGPFLWANYPTTPSTGYVSRTDINRIVSTDAGGLNDGKLRVVGTRKVGNNLEIRVDGKKDGEIDAGGYDTAAFNAFDASAVIGGRVASNFQDLEGDIAELIAIKGTLSDTEQANIEAFLKTRHGL